MSKAIYFAFGFSFRAEGGIDDLLARCETIEDARKAVEADAAYHGGYYGQYHGHIAVIEDGDLIVKWWYAARVLGDVNAGRIERQLWTTDRKELNQFISLLP